MALLVSLAVPVPNDEERAAAEERAYELFQEVMKQARAGRKAREEQVRVKRAKWGVRACERGHEKEVRARKGGGKGQVR